VQIGALFREHAPTFFLIEENDCSKPEAFNGERLKLLWRLQRRLDRLRRQPLLFFIGAAVEDNQEAEAGGLRVLRFPPQEFLVCSGGLFSQ